MRKGLLGVALIGCGAIVVLSMLATHYLGNTPKIAELRYIRELLATDGRLVRLYYAPSPPFPKAGTAGHGLRLIYKFQHGPAHGTLQQQANRLGDSIFRQWTGDPELAFVECRDASVPAETEGGWMRVEPVQPPVPPGNPATATPPPRGGSRD